MVGQEVTLVETPEDFEMGTEMEGVQGVVNLVMAMEEKISYHPEFFHLLRFQFHHSSFQNLHFGP